MKVFCQSQMAGNIVHVDNVVLHAGYLGLLRNVYGEGFE